MKRSSIFLIAAAFAIAVVWAGAVPRPFLADGSQTKNAEETITKLERSWAAAIVNKDTETLNRLLAPEFSGTSPQGMMYTKEMAIRALTSRVYVVETMYLDEISVNVYGNTAVAFTSQRETSTYGGEDFSGRYYYTDVWVKKDGRWQVVASHGSGGRRIPGR